MVTLALTEQRRDHKSDELSGQFINEHFEELLARQVCSDWGPFWLSDSSGHLQLTRPEINWFNHLRQHRQMILQIYRQTVAIFIWQQLQYLPSGGWLVWWLIELIFSWCHTFACIINLGFISWSELGFFWQRAIFCKFRFIWTRNSPSRI